MSTLAILVHGFNVWDGGRATVGKLRPFLAQQGIPYVMINYGWLGLLGTRLQNRRIAKRVAAAVDAGHKAGYRVVVVGHSNGCAITHLAACDYGAAIDLAVYINPALGSGCTPCSRVKALHVWYSPSDWPVRLAKLLWHCKARPWGAMGATGYKGTDARVTNYNKEIGYPVSSHEHSDMFAPQCVPYFGPVLAREIVDAISSDRAG